MACAGVRCGGVCRLSTIRAEELAVSPWERRKVRKAASVHKKRRRKGSKRRKAKPRRHASGGQPSKRLSGASRREQHTKAAVAEQRVRRSGATPNH